ncbi:putative E3 ubiquitin-protein ligase HERC3 isoform 3-T3 [Pholidichthys leucotaenia]
MFSWGDCHQGFFINEESSNDSRTDDGFHHLNLGCQIHDLSAGLNVLAFVKDGKAFIIRTNESENGRRVRGKQTAGSPELVKTKLKIVALSCGDDVVTLLSSGGSILCVDTHSSFTPWRVKYFSDKPVSQVSCGNQHSVVLTEDGEVFTWGQDSRGQLGLGTVGNGNSSPQHVRPLSNIPVVQIAAGGQQSFALSDSGGVFSWGRNNLGQLGLGDAEDRNTPTSVHSLRMKKVIQISCGMDHTVILTKHGAVFTFGSGQHGQLGHNSLRNELHPRLVAELWGAKVMKIACGRYHTLVMTDTKRVYSFGCGDQGQLGREEETHPSVPLPVQLPQEANESKIKTIFSGGNCSFAACSPDGDVQADSDRVSNVSQLSLDAMIDKWMTSDSKSWKRIKREISTMFSSATCMNQSFLEKSSDKHFQTSPKCPGLNLKDAQLAFEKLVKKDKIRSEVEASVLQLLPSLNKQPVGVEGLRIYLLLNELLHVMQKHNEEKSKEQTDTEEYSTKLEEAVAAAITNLSEESLQIIDWWCSLSPSTMLRYVNVWKKALSLILFKVFTLRTPKVRNLLQVLQYMYDANSRAAEPQRIPASAFCLQLGFVIIIDEVKRWLLQKHLKYKRDYPLIFCHFPFVMDLPAKQLFFYASAEYTKFGTLDEQRLHLMCQNGFRYEPPFKPSIFFQLKLRRASILEDTFDKLASADHTHYMRRLVVFWDENNIGSEVNIKDFFYEVFHEMVSAESGMFIFNDSETLAWFSSRVQPEDQRFFFFGLLCGLALHNHCIIHLPFPLVLFKKLLNVRPSLEDLKEFSPTVAKSLQSILEYSDDVLESLDVDFTIKWDGTKVDLDPVSPEKVVTGQNKKEFVDAYVNYIFNTSVETVFPEFRRGFFQVCEQELVRLLRPKELQGMIVGKDFHDWEKMKKNTVYEREYHEEHPTIQMFWEVFDELTESQKEAFLWFVTGFERIPICGIDTIKMQVRVKDRGNHSYDEYYPETFTCCSLLELPIYSSKEIMRTRLTEALSNRRISQR